MYLHEDLYGKKKKINVFWAKSEQYASTMNHIHFA